MVTYYVTIKSISLSESAFLLGTRQLIVGFFLLFTTGKLLNIWAQANLRKPKREHWLHSAIQLQTSPPKKYETTHFNISFYIY